MTRFLQLILILLLIFSFSCKLIDDSTADEGDPPSQSDMLIDHNCMDITKIPSQWFEKIKNDFRVHYAHTSHGSQLTVGLELLSNENSQYGFYADNCTIPDDDNFLCLMDGQQMGYCETYIGPEYYWQGNDALNITRNVLNSFQVNISLWAWCSQLDYFNKQQLQEYLDNLSQLESEFADIKFIYMTGNAQDNNQNRFDRNNEIRQFCQENNKILFDFADMDTWYQGNQHKSGLIPLEHPQYQGDYQGSHTASENCRNKAQAFWWLLARLSGWDGES